MDNKVGSLHHHEKMVNSYIMDFTCAILAGGRSKRMGRDKATLQVGEKALVKHVCDEAKRVFKEIIIISNHHRCLNGIDVPILKDIIPIQSPIVGIVSALLYASSPYVFVLACDMPFVSEKSMRYMISEARGEDLILPKTKGGYEPLYAIYGKSCIPSLFKLIEHNKLKVTEVFPFLSMRVLDENPNFMNNGYPVFMNINTVDDLSILQIDEERKAIIGDSRLEACNQDQG